MSAECRICGRVLATGETAWASDWKVLDVSGEAPTWRTEVRYACEKCEAAS